MACLSSTLLYGASADGKTTQVGSWAEWVVEQTKKPVRYYTAEPGGIESIGHLIDRGIVEPVTLIEKPNFSEALEWASEGYSWDKQGKLVQPQHDKYGGYIYEGGTSFGECLLEELRIKGAKNEIGGAEKPPQTYVSGTLRIAGANQTFFGISQGRVRRAITVSQGMPVHIIWTCREVKAVDDDMVSGYREIHGPQIVGSAVTPHIPAWFGACIHCTTVREGKEAKPVRKLFFKPHLVEGQKAPFVANPRLPASVVDDLPESVVATPTSLQEFMQLRAQLRKKASEIR